MNRFSKRRLWASELAQTQVCEQRMVLETRYGKRTSLARQMRMEEGTRAHQVLLRQSLRLNPHAESSRRPSPCFIATAVFGEIAPETEQFRAFRDRHLCNSTVGRLLIRLYYWISPPIAAWLACSPSSRHVAKMVLLRILALIQDRSDRGH
jgi:hypothetical protein